MSIAGIPLIGFSHLAVLLVVSGCMMLIDHRWRLYLFRFPRAALIVQVVGVVYLLAWDVAGIELGIFFRGTGQYATGIEWLVPDMTLEEPIFLWFLCHFTMILFTVTDRAIRHASALAQHTAGERS